MFYAIVRKNNKLVELVTKKGDFYLDTDNDPYREEELDFDVHDDRKSSGPQPSNFMESVMSSFSKNSQRMAYIQPAVQIATEYMKYHQNANAVEVAQFTTTIINQIKQL